MKLNLKLPLRGIVPPLVTPLLDTDKLDVQGLERLIEHTINGGVHGIFILGTTGEFASLSYKLRRELIKNTCEFVKGRVPVLVGITDSAFIESMDLANFAAESGADAVVLAPPYYYATGQRELLDYLEQIMKQMPLPLFIYNMPVHTKMSFSPEIVKNASEIPGIVGMKDSSSDLAYLKHVQYAVGDRKDFTFLVGPEEFLSEFVLTGGHGGVNGGANMFPKLYVELYNASVNRDFEKIAILQEKIMQISDGIYKIGQYGSSYLKGVKCTLSIMGICNDTMAYPFRKFNNLERNRIAKNLQQLNYKSLT